MQVPKINIESWRSRWLTLPGEQEFLQDFPPPRFKVSFQPLTGDSTWAHLTYAHEPELEIYSRSGDILIESEGELFTIKSGEVAKIPSGIRYRVVIPNYDQKDCIRVWDMRRSVARALQDQH